MNSLSRHPYSYPGTLVGISLPCCYWSNPLSPPNTDELPHRDFSRLSTKRLNMCLHVSCSDKYGKVITSLLTIPGLKTCPDISRGHKCRDKRDKSPLPRIYSQGCAVPVPATMDQRNHVRNTIEPSYRKERHEPRYPHREEPISRNRPEVA